MKINSEQEMLAFGEELAVKCTAEHKDLARAARSVSEGHATASSSSIIIELVGDVGAGKTTLVRGLAKGLGVEEPVTSPSFTISKSYAGKEKTLVHYDFYRLDDPGIMSEDLEENLKNPNNIIVIEWGESVKNLLPENHTKITIKYNDDDTREVEIS